MFLWIDSHSLALDLERKEMIGKSEAKGLTDAATVETHPSEANEKSDFIAVFIEC